MSVLGRALKDVAQNMVPHDQREYHRADKPDYGREVYRLGDVGNYSKTGYGFFYFRNDSGYQLNENVKATLKGFEIVGRENCEIRLAPGTDDIIILRQTERDRTYSWLSEFIPRSYSNAEFILKAKAEPAQKWGEHLTWHYKHGKGGCCFYFKTTDPYWCYRMTLEFPTMDNLRIRHCPIGVNKTFVELESNGGQGVIFLDPIDRTKWNSWNMSRSYRQFRGTDARKPDQGILDWVTNLWPNYDQDQNGKFTNAETWVFVQENMKN